MKLTGDGDGGQWAARTAEDGSARQAVEVVAEELGPSLRWATATPVKASTGAAEGEPVDDGGASPGR